MTMRKHSKTDAAEHRMNEMLDQARRQAWTGPDQSPRVEAHLKGITMKAHPKFTLTRNALILLGISVVAGGSLAAAVTHTVLSQRATIIADDGTRYDVELAETPDGASGTFTTDDGATYGIEMVEGEEQQTISVDVNSPNGGTTTVILDDGSAPSVLTEPGQAARIEISEDTASQDSPPDSEDE
jgi:hypothetical protein